ncbi:FGGY family carbohydrate kinase [Mycobacterium sp. NPDC003449]
MPHGHGGRSHVVCGVDIGSTNTKVIALDPRGVVVARLSRSTPRATTGAPVDALALLADIERMILKICSDRFLVSAVCAAGVGEDGALVDDTLTAITPALAWFDPRRVDVLAALMPSLDNYAHPCVGDDAARTIVGWRWAVDQPGAERAHSWLALTDYAPSVWSGTAFMSDTLAARTAAWDGRTRTWIDARVAAGIGSERLLPPVRKAGDIVGDFVSGRLPISGVIAPDAVVVAGGHDHPVGGWGVHRMDPNSLLDSMGTAEVVVAQSPSHNVEHGQHIDTAPGIRSAGTTVLSVEELARNVEWASRDPEVKRELDAIIAGDRLPDEYLREPVFLPGSRGGGRPHFTTDAPRAAVSRASAVLGALARIGERAQHAVGSHLTGQPRVYAAGGWSRSPGWISAKAAATGQDITVIPESQVTATGAALLAANAIGWDPVPGIALGMVPATSQPATSM